MCANNIAPVGALHYTMKNTSVQTPFTVKKCFISWPAYKVHFNSTETDLQAQIIWNQGQRNPSVDIAVPWVSREPSTNTWASPRVYRLPLSYSAAHGSLGTHFWTHNLTLLRCFNSLPHPSRTNPPDRTPLAKPPTINLSFEQSQAKSCLITTAGTTTYWRLKLIYTFPSRKKVKTTECNVVDMPKEGWGGLLSRYEKKTFRSFGRF